MAVSSPRTRSLLRRRGADGEGGEHTEVDPLTGLPTRAVFLRRLDRLFAVRRATRRRGGCTVLLIDCDRFSEVNRVAGYTGGDSVLCDIAERLRQMFADAHLLARTGGDEFGIIIDQVPSAAELLAMGEQLVGGLHQPVTARGAQIDLGASIGVAICGREQVTAGAQATLRCTSIALRMAKRAGRGRFALYEESLKVALENPERRQRGLDAALSRRQFAVRYQPIVALSDLAIVGFEALLRWHHPDGTELAPGEFLPELEATGLIDEVGGWVLGQACMRCAALRRETGATVFAMVNVSERQLRDPHFAERVTDALHAFGLPPDSLVLEINDASAVTEHDDARETLDVLRETGVHVAIDDVGAGYASMLQLRDMPIDVIKIDPAFVNQLVDRNQRPSTAASLVRLGEALNLMTIAEGVETVQQHLAVSNLGCHMAQGYRYAAPMTEAELSTAVRTRGATRNHLDDAARLQA